MDGPRNVGVVLLKDQGSCDAIVNRDELNQLWLDLEQAMGCLTFLDSIQHQSEAVTHAIEGARLLVEQARERVANESLRSELCV